jgi:hypothetical protein
MSEPQGMNDPAYQFEMDQLAERCREFLAAHQAANEMAMLLQAGMLTAQCAVVYKLSPPSGLVDIPALFRRDTDSAV